MDLNRRGSVKSAMIKSFFNSSQNSSVKQTASCQKTYKSSKKVVTSSGSKVAVFESESEGLVTSETVGDQTTTESEYSAAERYCELEKEEGADDIEKLMTEEMERLMNAPMRAMLKSEEEEQEEEGGETGKSDACPFGICPENTPCMCMDDCAIELDGDEGAGTINITAQQLQTKQED